MTRRARCSTRWSRRRSRTCSPRDLDRIGVRPARRSASRPGAGRSRWLARADRNVPPGLVFIPFCYAEAAANLLTNPALDPFGKIPEFKFCAARIAKVGTRGTGLNSRIGM